MSDHWAKRTSKAEMDCALLRLGTRISPYSAHSASLYRNLSCTHIVTVIKRRWTKISQSNSDNPNLSHSNSFSSLSNPPTLGCTLILLIILDMRCCILLFFLVLSIHPLFQFYCLGSNQDVMAVVQDYERDKYQTECEEKAVEKERCDMPVPIEPKKPVKIYSTLASCCVTVPSYRINRGFAQYEVMIKTVNGDVYRRWLRFSQLTAIQQKVRMASGVPSTLSLPVLPSRTFLRKLDAEYLQSRSELICVYLNNLFSILSSVRMVSQQASNQYSLVDHVDVRKSFGFPLLPGHPSVAAISRRLYDDDDENELEDDETTTSESESAAASEEDTPLSPSARLPEQRKNSIDFFEFDDANPELKAFASDSGKTHEFKLRDLNYLNDKKKRRTCNSVFKLMHVDFFSFPSAGRCDHVAVKGRCKARMARLMKLDERPFLFILNFQICSQPPVSIVSYFAMPLNILSTYQQSVACSAHEISTFLRILDKFIAVPSVPLSCKSLFSRCKECARSGKFNDEGNNDTVPICEDGELPQDDFRNMRFKVVPQVQNGPWVVQKAVGGQIPSLLGQRLTQRYYRGPNYMEVDVDVASSIVASRIVSLMVGYAAELVIDVAVVFQGEVGIEETSEEDRELPELPVGVLRLNRADLSKAESLY